MAKELPQKHVFHCVPQLILLLIAAILSMASFSVYAQTSATPTCIPGASNDTGCSLYNVNTDYSSLQNSSLCKSVCAIYKNSAHTGAIQTAYTCDATLCTSMGIGQPTPSSTTHSLAELNSNRASCTGLSTLALGLIKELEATAHCSCCASQVCGCAKAGIDINLSTQNAISSLDQEQSSQGIVPQCYLNGTLCGQRFTYNNTNTTEYGTAAADVYTIYENFLPCSNPPATQTSKSNFKYGLCYYSGPAKASGVASNPSLPCKLFNNGQSADCLCYAIDPYKENIENAGNPINTYYIDINAILNLDIYQRTVEACGVDGTLCPKRDDVYFTTSPACRAVNQDHMMPNTDIISVFSLTKQAKYNPGLTSCANGKYAGCMTAPCQDTGAVDPVTGDPLVECICPVVEGPFDIGQPDVSCDAGDGYVWSAARHVDLE